MDENFLLQTPLSRRLYHGCAEKLPVIEYKGTGRGDELP